MIHDEEYLLVYYTLVCLVVSIRKFDYSLNYCQYFCKNYKVYCAYFGK